MLDWLIIGGGVHGTHISRVLTQRGGVAPDRVRVLDPHVEPLTRWHACAHNTGMTFLHSPAAHNIDVQPADLHHFAEYEVKDAPTRGRIIGPPRHVVRGAAGRAARVAVSCPGAPDG